MENRRKIFIRRHARSKLERRVEMTCDRGIVSFSDKIVQDGETEGKKIFLSSRCLLSFDIVLVFVARFDKIYIFLIYHETYGKFIR